jgi:type III secretion protein Q
MALARLYGYDALFRTIDGTRWRFRWRFIRDLVSGVELRLRIGGLEAAILIEDLGAFGSAVDVTRPELPALLRVVYLSGLARLVWRELEILTERAVELVAVQPNCTIDPATDCVGFEVGVDLHGVATRGVLRPLHPDLQDLLLQVSRREMADPPVPGSLSIRWSAVVGSTRLTAEEARTLEEHDIVVVDNAAYAADGLSCWLGAGPQRRYAGRATLRRDGQLQLIEFRTRGQAIMTNADADAVAPDEVGFGDIPVNLRFELVRWETPLAEVASWSAGAVIDLGQRIDEQSVTVWVEQRCIGKGQLVAVGERLGVRLLTILARRT